MKTKKLEYSSLFAFFLLFNTAYIFANDSPQYISLEPDITQYYQYANGGWDGNWYVGYNSCWITKLPPIITKSYKKAYIGAKLGRAKTTRSEDKPWLSVPVEGKIFMAISQDAGFDSQDTYLLVENSDIPTEAPKNGASLMAGNSQWFWVEVPIEKISIYRANFIALWSDARQFASSESSPIVAGANTNGNGGSAWLYRSGKGTPPREASKAPEIPLKGIAPAVAIKLVPANNEKIDVDMEVNEENDKFVAKFDVKGRNIYRAWLEISYDGFHWNKLSHYMFNPPYVITLYKRDMPDAGFYIRAAACDTLENRGYSEKKQIKR